MRSFGLDIRAERTKMMTNSANDIHEEFKEKGRGSDGRLRVPYGNG